MFVNFYLVRDPADSQPYDLNDEHTHTDRKQPVGQPPGQENIRDLAVLGAAVFGHGSQRAGPLVEYQDDTLDKVGADGDKKNPVEGSRGRGKDIVDETAEHEPEGDAVGELDPEDPAAHRLSGGYGTTSSGSAGPVSPA